MHKTLISSIKISLLLLIASCGGGGGGGSEEITSNTNLNPPSITSPTSFSVQENKTAIGTALATDSSAVTYTISGTDAGAVSINGTSGIMTFSVAPDFETKNTYAVILNASDGSLTSTQNITINITDEPKISSTSLSLVENTLAVGSIVASGSDGALSYSLSGTDAASFDIVKTTGAITFKVAPDYEVKNKYTVNVNVASGSETSTKELAINVTNYALVYAAKEKLISIGYNIPVTNPANQTYVAGLDVPTSIKTFYEDVQQALNETLGGYPNYVHVIWNDAGTQENAQPVLTKVGELKNATLSLSDLSQSCLNAANPGTKRTASTNPHSICYETMAWTDDPFGGGGTDFNKAIELALHYAHEYFHHYQRVHALERGHDYQYDRLNPSTTVQSPRWWIEPTAVTFQNAWLKKYFKKITIFENSTYDDIDNVSIANVSNANKYKYVRRALMGASGSKTSNCTTSWTLTSLEEKEETRTACEANDLILPFLAYKTSYKAVWVDMNIEKYDLGFYGALEKVYGKTKDEFYADFNTFIKSGNAEDEPPAGWAPSDTDIDDADFMNITPEAL